MTLTVASSGEGQRKNALVRTIKRTSGLEAPIVALSGAHGVSRGRDRWPAPITPVLWNNPPVYSLLTNRARSRHASLIQQDKHLLHARSTVPSVCPAAPQSGHLLTRSLVEDVSPTR